MKINYIFFCLLLTSSTLFPMHNKMYSKRVQTFIDNNPDLSPQQVALLSSPTVSNIEDVTQEQEKAFFDNWHNRGVQLSSAQKGQLQFDELTEKYKEVKSNLPSRDEALRDDLKIVHETIVSLLDAQADRSIVLSQEAQNTLKKRKEVIMAERRTTMLFRVLHAFACLNLSDKANVQEARDKIVEQFERAGNFNALGVNCEGNTLSHLLVNYSFFSTAKKIFSNNPDAANKLNNDGFSPFHVAFGVEPKDVNFIKWMIENVQLGPDHENFMPLHYIAKECSELISLCIKKQQADINAKSMRNDTALATAAFFGGDGVVALLDDPRVDVAIEDAEGYVALDKALMSEKPSIKGILALLKFGAKQREKGRNKFAGFTGQWDLENRLYEIVHCTSLDTVQDDFNFNFPAIKQETVKGSSSVESDNFEEIEVWEESDKKKIAKFLKAKNYKGLKKELSRQKGALNLKRSIEFK